MNLKNLFAVLILTLLIFIPKIEAANAPRVMVVELGNFEKPISVNSDGTLAADLIIDKLADSKRFILIDYEFIEMSIQMNDFLDGIQDLQITSTTPLGRAMEIAAKFDVDYIVYGDFNSLYGNSFIAESKFKDGDFKSVKVTMILHMLEVKTGRIVSVAKGEGISKSSEIENPKNLTKNLVPRICLRNATYKAADSAVENLIASFSE